MAKKKSVIRVEIEDIVNYIEQTEELIDCRSEDEIEFDFQYESEGE